MARPYRVLAIDGGGVRGIIPATVLADLERRVAPLPLSSLFDLIVGTSTGGILALGLTVPGDNGPKHTAASLRQLYIAEAEAIFPSGGPPNFTQRILGTRHPRQWLRDPIAILKGSAQRAGAVTGGNPRFAGGARYSSEGRDEVLERYLSDAHLSEALTHVLITSYDMAFDEPMVFSSQPVGNFVTDVPMHVVARATSAGPTYFAPEEYVDGERDRALVDGGVYVNNPAILGYLFGEQAAEAANRSLALVSLGTGTRNPGEPRKPADVKTANWLAVARMVMEAAMTGSSVLGDALLTRIADDETFRYWRLQTTVGTCSFAMDDSRPANMRCLAELGQEVVAVYESELSAIAAMLIEANG